MATTLSQRIKAESTHRMNKRRVGLFGKYRVSRTDGSSQKGKKHHGCNHFVLDITHDKFASVAVAAYAAACRHEYPALSEDLLHWVKTGQWRMH